jgi:hypothetical protein
MAAGERWGDQRDEQQAERWERSPEVLWRRLADGVAVLPRDGSAVLTLEGLQAEVWGALGRPVTIDGLVEQVGDRLGPDPSTRRQVAAEAVRSLVAAGAVRESVERSVRESSFP